MIAYCASMLRAQTIRYADPSKPSSDVDGPSWANTGNLQAMINQSAPGDFVYVLTGNFPQLVPITMKEGVKIFGGFVGTEAGPAERVLPVNQTIISSGFGNH